LLAAALAIVLLAIATLAGYFVTKDKQVAVDTTLITDSTQQTETDIKEQVPETHTFDSSELQEVVDAWAAGISGTASVVITDTDGVVLVTLNPDEIYFAASIYKLYVAYEGYRQVDAGKVDVNEIYLNNQTRKECLDLMIRESDSPCAEELWVEIGKQELTNILVSYGITNTSMTAISTTAADAANMLARIARGEGLSADSRNALLESMKNQIFRDSLNKGFSENVTIYNKIGFNEMVEYHDVAIVELQSGEQIIVSVLTEGVGTNNIANLATLLEEKL
jgi:beta-lactamase class A